MASVFLQIRIESDIVNPNKKEFTKEELETIQASMYALCHTLEKIAYVSCGMYLEGKSYDRPL